MQKHTPEPTTGGVRCAPRIGGSGITCAPAPLHEPGARFLVNDTESDRSGRKGTYLRWQSAKACRMLLLDGAGRNGAGETRCFPPSSLRELPSLTLRRVLAGMRDERAPPRRRRRSPTLAVCAEGEWCAGLRLPLYLHATTAPAVLNSTALHLKATRELALGGRAPVIPSLFVPGFPKSATTWLYGCLLDAFAPSRVGCGDDARHWNASACPRRFLLTTMSASRWKGSELLVEPRKETFFFGGSRQALYRKDLVTLTGPDSARGARGAGEPALWLWEVPRRRASSVAQRLREHGATASNAGALSRAQVLGLERRLVERLSAMCRGAPGPCDGGGAARDDRKKGRAPPRTAVEPAAVEPAALGGVPLDDCTHAACHRVVRGVRGTSTPQCDWQPHVSSKLGRNDSYCLHSATPWAAAAEYNLLLGDFTPNYLCDADALPRLRRASPRPDELRFIVVMREPLRRAFSEWAMFALQWAWDPIPSFEASLAVRAKQIRDCDRTLFRNASALKALPTAELSKYLGRCFGRGGAMMYAQTSMYSVCVLHALRFFDRSQFLFLRYEDLMAMDTATLLRLVSRFTGLHADAAVVGAALKGGKCTPRGGRRPPSTFSTLSGAEKMLYNASAARVETPAVRELTDLLFAPYDELLAELVHADFGWGGRGRRASSEPRVKQRSTEALEAENGLLRAELSRLQREKAELAAG